MRKILVTGATGFIGRYVVEELIRLGHTVVASSADAAKARTASWYPKAEYIPFDLSRMDASCNYYAFFGKPETLIHLAWEGLPHYKEAFHLEVNYPRHAAFLGNMVNNGLSDLTVIGTCLEYGMQEGELREDMPAHPANAYAEAKDRLRRRLEALSSTRNFDFRWVRLFYMYGKGQNPNSLLSQLENAIGRGDKVFNMSGGEQQRDYLPVEKVASYIVRIALQSKVTGVINCCSGRPVKVIDLVRDFLKDRQGDIALNPGYYPYPDYEPMRFWGANTKLKTILKDE
ncbi:MAG TPA: NAD(P)-dependent oxidoreductase [Puia sp.]|nr:NAD(P)-dependent oxidoreductase [Puia sp.]